MANKSLFASWVGKLIPATDTINNEGAAAHAFSSEHALAQYALTGCTNSTFYATAEQQLSKVLELTSEVSPEFLAKLAIYSRSKGHMKDLPALLCAVLASRDGVLLERIFDRVIDNGKMLRNFVQIIRSGVTGRKSLGTRPKRLVRKWIESRSGETLFRDSVGSCPSFADVVKMVHPRPSDKEREAFYGYMIGKTHDAESLPQLIRDFEAYKAVPSAKMPAVPFQMLTALNLGEKQWCEIAMTASWQMTRMNLNTFGRHGVYNDAKCIKAIARRLSDASEIRKARALPYQLLVAYREIGEEVPNQIRDALQDAMEIAVKNVPAVNGRIVVCPDVSGSMSSPITGMRKGSTSKVRCIDVAALVAAAFMRKNSDTLVLPFEQDVVKLSLNSRDSIMTNAEKLASIGGGGTNCSAPLALLNKKKACAEVVILVSDNESWVDATNGRGTETMKEWFKFKVRNPKARLVCIDIQPNSTSQAKDSEDTMNVGGFSDQVFEVIGQFVSGNLTTNHFVNVIERVEV